MNKFLVILFFVFFIKMNGQNDDKIQVMSDITCECINNISEEVWENNPEKNVGDCFDAAVLGGLLSMINLDNENKKDSISVTIGSNKVTSGNSEIGEINDEDLELTRKQLEKNCDRYKSLMEEDFTSLINKASVTSCECISKINVALPLAEKNNNIQNCITESVSTKRTPEERRPTTVEGIRSVRNKIQKKLVENCEAIEQVVFSDNEDKLNSYSNNDKAMKQYSLGMNASDNEDYKRAIKHYKKAVSIDKNFVFAWDNLGVTYRKLNKFDKAIEAYQSSLKVDAYNRTALMNIAVAYGYKKDFDNAIKYYEILKSYYPEDPESPYGLSLNYLQKGDLEKSLLNAIIALNLYKKAESPYQADAEKLMGYLFSEFEKKGKEESFKRICEENNLKLNFK